MARLLLLPVLLLLFSWAALGLPSAAPEAAAAAAASSPVLERGLLASYPDDVVYFTDGKVDDLTGIYTAIHAKVPRIHIVTTASPDHVRALRHWVSMLVLQGIHDTAPYNKYNKHTKIYFYSTLDNIIDIEAKDNHYEHLLDPDDVIPGVVEKLYGGGGSRKQRAKTKKLFVRAGGHFPSSPGQLNTVDDLLRKIPRRAKVNVHMVGPTAKEHLVKVVRQESLRLGMYHALVGFNSQQNKDGSPELTRLLIDDVYEAVKGRSGPRARVVYTNSWFSFPAHDGNQQPVADFEKRLHPIVMAFNRDDPFYYRQLGKMEARWAEPARAKGVDIPALAPPGADPPQPGEKPADYARRVLRSLTFDARTKSDPRSRELARYFSNYARTLAGYLTESGAEATHGAAGLVMKVAKQMLETKTMEMCDGVHVALLYKYLGDDKHFTTVKFHSNQGRWDVTAIDEHDPEKDADGDGGDYRGVGLIGMTNKMGTDALTDVMPENDDYVDSGTLPKPKTAGGAA